MPTPSAIPKGFAVIAALLAFASAATTAYWVTGGTALLDTVGGYAEDFARTRTPTALLAGIAIVVVKVVGGLLALALARRTGARRGAIRALGWLGGALLTVYGGLLVAVGALVLVGAIHPDGPVDRRVLTWHVALWDLWFLLWGIALLGATWAARRASRPAR